ncbi:VTT domain-containing protein [Tahibacter sp.]|uniref:TVP38/TMEM64 family protein n=1 Tax=Tahibacter sp. TaxID=2056211 RepID=UPI0028C4B4B7|nr:VTT domain-containing protein [Tahibacter sp.]
MKRLRSLAPLLLLVLIGVGLFASGVLDRFGPSGIAAEQHLLQEQIATRPLLAALVHVGIITAAIATGIPGTVVLILAGGMLFGGLLGAVLSSIGVILGASVLYAASRFAFSGDQPGRAPALVERLRQSYHAHPHSYTFFLRLVPVFPFGGVTVALAWLRCPPWLFVLATAVGGSVTTTIESLLGAGLAQNLARNGTIDSHLLADPWFIGPMFGMALLALLPIVLNRWRARRAARTHTPPSS